MKPNVTQLLCISIVINIALLTCCLEFWLSPTPPTPPIQYVAAGTHTSVAIGGAGGATSTGGRGGDGGVAICVSESP